MADLDLSLEEITEEWGEEMYAIDADNHSETFDELFRIKNELDVVLEKLKRDHLED